VSSRSLRTRPGLVLGAILVVALVARLAAIAADDDYVPANDAFDYHRHAQSIAAGEGYPEALLGVIGGPTAFRPPGYPFFLAGVYELAGGDARAPSINPPTAADLPRLESRWTAGRVANAVLGTVAVLLIFLIARRIWDREVGLVAAAIAAIYPPLIFLSTELLTEPLFIALELGAVLAVLAYRHDPGRARWVLIAGVLCGLAALTRSNGIIVAVLAAAGVWVLRPRLSGRALAAPALLALVAALVVAPWALRNYSETGRFVAVSTQLGFSIAGTYNITSFEDDDDQAAWRVPAYEPPYDRLIGVPTIDEATLHSTMRREATEFALDHPAYVAEATYRNLLRTFNIGASGVVSATGPVEERGVGTPVSDSESVGLWVAMALAAVGVVALAGLLPRRGSRADPRERWARGPLFMWLIPVLMIAVAVPIIGLPRYRAVADPFIVVLAAVGTVTLLELIRARRGASVAERSGEEMTPKALRPAAADGRRGAR
jgi:4-amino-4-deoxy-L-arabinose transferase-like glycosyltransferase